MKSVLAALDRRLSRHLAAPAPLRSGLLQLALVAAWYAFAILLLALGGVAPGMDPWLAIAPEDYFIWEALFIGPGLFLTALLAGALMYLLARAAGGRGSFDDTLALLAPATAWGTLCTLVPDTLIGLALIVGLIDPEAWMEDIRRPSLTLVLIWVYLLAYTAAFLVAYPAVARVAHALHGWRAWAIGAATFFVYQFVLFVFVR